MSPFGGRRLSCDRARSWLAERVDGPLDPRREAALEAHLAGCADCREADTEYHANRAALRQLPPPLPPRDLPARTLAALEVEARRVRPPRAAPVTQLRSARRSGGMAFGSLVTVALVAVVGALLIGPAVQIPGPGVGATPFAIAPVDLAFVGVQGDVVRLYRARLDQACPADSISCAEFGPQADQLVDLPRTTAVSGLAFDPAGRHAAIAATSGIGTVTTYYVVDLGSNGPLAGAGGTATTAGSPAIVSGASAATSPATTPRPSTRTFTRSPDARATRNAQTAETTATPKTEATATPRPTVTEHTARGTARPTSAPHPAASASPTSILAPRASVDLHAQSGGTAGLTAGSSGLGPGSTSGAPATGATAAGSAAPASGTAGLELLPSVPAQPILENVIPTGASPAWSPDGSTLAFSAMPADGSAGPDIYVWHPGDAQAVAITTDHVSSFASWAGSRIVGSTYSTDPVDPAVLTPQSFLLDPQTGDRIVIAGAPLWLPSVDPTGRYVVGWSGTLRSSGLTPVPDQGQLVFADWSTLDPLAATTGTDAGIQPAPVPTGTPGLDASASARPASRGAIKATPATPPDASPAAAAAAPGASATTPGASATAGASGLPTAPQSALQPLDASPSPGASPFQDWVVAWSPDGSAVAVWEGPVTGGQTGTLSLHSVDQTLDQIDAGGMLLGPVPASRQFSIGLDRLVWTAPADAQGFIQLRVLVWGSFGRGELRSLQLNQQQIVPAF